MKWVKIIVVTLVCAYLLLASSISPGVGTVTSVTIAGTAGQITATGTCTVTSTGTCTLSLPSTITEALTFSAVNTHGGALNLGTTPTDYLIAENTTASTSGVPVQISPGINQTAHVWNTTATAADNTYQFRQYLLPVSGTTPTATEQFCFAPNSGTFTCPTAIDSGGNYISNGFKLYINNNNGGGASGVQYVGGDGTSLLYISTFTIQGSSAGATIPSAASFLWGTIPGTTINTGISRPSSGLISFDTTTAGNSAASWKATNGTLILGGLYECTHGSNATCGVATLSGGTVTVSTTAIGALATTGAGYAISLTELSCSSCGSLSIGTVTASTSFVINSTNASDASNVYWEIRYIN